MATPAAIGEAFRRLQGGDAAGALEIARRIAAEEPRNARARLAIGIALRLAGRLDEAAAAFDEAERLDPRDHAPPYEIGLVRQMQGRGEEALAAYDRALRARPSFFAAHFSAGLLHAERREWERAGERFRAVLALRPNMPEALLHLAMALERQGRDEEAESTYVHALAADPHHVPTLRSFGQSSAAHGNFRRAASLFGEAARLDPHDEALPMFAAQAELLLGRWGPAWAAYARRAPRRAYEHAAARRGQPYAVPSIGDLDGARVTLVGEQGLGDTLFFLRWAPRLRERGAVLSFAGDARLHPLLARTGLFEGFLGEEGEHGPLPVLAGDLPALFAGEDPATVATLSLAPLPARLEAWRERMQAAGPRPWIGASWRAGTPAHVVAHALSKEVPVASLFAALPRSTGTTFALQREPSAGELDSASAALGAPVHDFTGANADLDDVLAIAILLDRNVSVSNTNLHLAAAAGATADVLVPFPPEWRWRLEGDSPWFPGFRTHRQAPGGDWSAALAGLRRLLAAP